MIKVGVVGATGYSARESIRLLSVHPGVEVVAVASGSSAGIPLSDVLPAFRKVVDLRCETFDAASLASRCDVVFVGVPSTKSMAFGADLRAAGARVIDVGPDFRLKDPASFATHYKTAHTAPELLSEAVYGLVPWYRESLRTANLVAVPGCYPISALTPLKALASAGLTDIPIVIDSISGITGAGRSLNEAYHFPEMNENLRAYQIAVHRHTPEIEQEIGHGLQVQFTPHVAPLNRGILTTITLRPKGKIDIAAAFSRYDKEPFVRVLPPGSIPEVKHVRASTFCDIGWVMDNRTGNLIIVSAIDNLMGGTAGMAIQCMNVMFGLDERTGLTFGGMAP
ncbi:MAG: N-acetyl-gamma-glutamyl-phosphate reductase [FCB group bacterium]|nr:N-acetyl-gamma-glutamyl-phosphate reductase [FCB group bacterium]